MDEFSLIKKFFHNEENSRIAHEKKVTIPNGDDGAVFSVNPEKQFVSSMDTLIRGVHFPGQTCASDIAYKALAVNLSDLAAMGASPHSFSLSLTLPEIDELWLSEFSDSLFQVANRFNLVLLGGDTSKGPLSISIHILGEVNPNRALRRGAACVGDAILVTGYLGLAALGLSSLEKENEIDKKKYAGITQVESP